MRTGGTARYHWNFPICPMRVTIDYSVIRALQHDLEVGGNQLGLLFGKEEEGATHINGREPIAAAGRADVQAAIATAKRAPVGYYRIRDGRAFILTSEEIELAADLFQRPGAVVLLAERRGPAAAEATFFFRRGGSFVHNLPMPFPLDADLLAAETSAPLPVPAARRQRYRVTVQRAVAVAAAAATGIGLAAMSLRKVTHTSPQPAPLAIKRPARTPAANPAAGLQFFWDPKSMPGATAGLLEIDDGGLRQTIPLDGEQLNEGAIDYVPTSDRIKVELSTLQRDGRIVEADVSVRVGPGASHVSVTRFAPAVKPPEPQPVQQLPPSKPAADADRKLMPKPFTLAIRRVETPAAPVVIDPPALPAPTVTGAVLPIVPAVRPYVPPPAPSASPAPTRFVASAGRLIWTGTLGRRGVVELDGRSASIGSISGALPGVPVNVSISPAEFEGDGLVVYTGDAARNQRVEPASAANGWNKVKWVWDPSRVAEIALLEPPNQSNGFNHLAFRNDARRTSIVWIDWRARP